MCGHVWAHTQHHTGKIDNCNGQESSSSIVTGCTRLGVGHVDVVVLQDHAELRFGDRAALVLVERAERLRHLLVQASLVVTSFGLFAIIVCAYGSSCRRNGTPWPPAPCVHRGRNEPRPRVPEPSLPIAFARCYDQLPAPPPL